jgi:predicted DNA-binding protein with PD1-like motif
MKSKLVTEQGAKTYVLVFASGDEVIAGLQHFAIEQKLDASAFTALGAFRAVTLGYFDWEKKHYDRIEIKEQVEVLSLVGNVAQADDGPKVHAHVVIAKRDGTAHGGHLLAATVRPTLEVTLTESPAHLRRRHDPRTGLALIDIEQL